MSTEAEVWECVLDAMPFCDCGAQVAPGSLGDEYLLVCRKCSAVSVADPLWVDRIVEQARDRAATRDVRKGADDGTGS